MMQWAEWIWNGLLALYTHPWMQAVFPWLTGGSVVFAVLALAATFIALPRILAGLPRDYFLPEAQRAPHAPDESLPVWAIRNGVGWTLIVLGVLMLVLPGQGLLSILAGLVLADVPLKRPMMRLLLSQGPVRSAVDALRARHGAPPLEL
jgi:hypothetical protein